ncbi:MAG: DUF262 domain-containing protein [Deltaproteobacteria bacterium]|nr:DUF262 domain-containing protein [Deltaproteobacteria bacterium]
METHKIVLFDLFRRERQYCVPLFQRPYVWSQQKQWEPLWNDVLDRSKAILDQQARGSRRIVVRNHFLGAIVTRHLDVFGQHIDAAEVIDGQQRLTTLQILFSAFHDFLRNLPEDDAGKLARIASDLGTLTRNDGVLGADNEAFKVWPTNADRATFEKVVTAGSAEEVETRFPLVRRKWNRNPDPRPRLAEAYLYFHEAIHAFCYETDDGVDLGLEQRAHALYEALRRHVLLVHIELQDDDDPQVIFESLNARGEPLHPSDLIRNFVFMRASAQDLDPDALYMEWWREYDERMAPPQQGEDHFWKQMERQGRLRRPRLDLFVFHYLQSLLGEEFSIGHLYQAFRDWWEDSEEDRLIENELRRMRAHSEVFARLIAPSEDDPLATFARRLSVLDTSTVYPVLLFILVGGKDRAATSDVDGILTDLESFLVRRMICGLTTKSYNKLFVGLLRRLREAERIDRALVQGFLLEGTGPAVLWPDDTQFRRSWLSRPVYTELKAYRVAMLLRAVNLQLHTSKQEPIRYTGALTIEHVMPQAWADAWPAPVESETPAEGDETAVNRRNRLIHTFGNLTLLTRELNLDVSNGPFGLKRPEIAEQSLIRMNAWFQRAEKWDEEEIIKRGAALADVAIEVWQRPVPSE